MKYFCYFIQFILVVVQGVILADEIPLIPRELLFGNPQKVGPQISPQGTLLAYLAPDENNVLNVWIKDLEKGEERKITNEKTRGIRSFTWLYDQDHILYEQDKDGDENNHLYKTHIQTLITTDLTPFSGVKATVLKYLPEYPQEMLITLNQRNPALFDVYRLNLITNKLVLDTENPGDIYWFFADHQMNIKIAQAYTKDGGFLVKVREDKNSPWVDFLSVPGTETEGRVIGFTHDDKGFYLLSSLDGLTSHLIQVDLKTGKRTKIYEDPEFDTSHLLKHPTTHLLEAVGVDRDYLEWVAIDPKMGADFQFLNKTLPSFQIVNSDLSHRNWIVSTISDKQPITYYLYQRETKNLKYLFNSRPELSKYPLNDVKPISFYARDGMKLHGYLALPAGKEARSLPTVILVHGGPAVRDSWGFAPTVQWLANRGYAVLQINYRGSSGFGRAYLQAGNGEWGGKMHTDLLDGKEWAIKQGYSDPNKVAIYGGSYGGYAVLVGLAFTPDEFCCGVDVVGPSNLYSLIQTMPPYWNPVKALLERRIGTLTDLDFLKERSPLFKAHQIKKPLMIVQGANDPRVKQSESDQIAEAMRKNNLPVDYLLFPDEGHGFSGAKPDNRLKYFAAAENFLHKYLKGRLEPPSEKENWHSLKVQ